METTLDLENFYRENGWAHLDFGDTKRVTTGLNIRPIVFTREEIDQLEMYRAFLDIIWIEIKVFRNDDQRRLRDKLYDESALAFKYIKSWFEAQRISGKTEFELLAEPEYL